MFQRITDRLNREDKGFTLIELMVVVLIIAILIAIAIPTFLGARERAQDRAAQSSLRNAVTNAKAIYTDNETYVQATVAALDAAEPSLQFTAAATVLTTANEPTLVSVSPTSANEFHVASMSKSGTCWMLREAVDPLANPGTGWVKVTDGAPTCSGASAALVLDTAYAPNPGAAPAQ